MASPSTETPRPLRLRDIIDHGDDEDDGDVIAEEPEEEEEEEDDEEEERDMSRRMSRLSMEGSDGGDADDEDEGYRRGVAGEAEEEEEEDEDDEFEVRSDVNGATYGGAHRAWPPYDVQAAAVPSSASLPGTPERSGAQAAQSPWWPGPSSASKEYASETEARWPGSGGAGAGAGKRRQRHRRRERMVREVWLERAWRMRKQRRQLLDQGALDAVPLVVLGGGGGAGGESPGAAARAGVAMDMEEMRACRDLGLDLPCDWTVEIPCYVDTASSGGNSPASGSWRISSPGDDPNDVKARLKVWAQAVALASASRLGS
ncbi:hypothetical protein ACP4OV_021050 [Aristida adscensionis]